MPEILLLYEKVLVGLLRSIGPKKKIYLQLFDLKVNITPVWAKCSMGIDESSTHQVEGLDPYKEGCTE